MKRSPIKMFYLLSVMAILWMGVGGPSAYALSSMLNTFNTRYGTSGTKLNSCGLCHISATNPSFAFNAYGNDMENQIANVGLGTAAALAAIESLDSDGDGFTNLAEITARSFPYDPADRPAPATAPNMGVSPASLGFATVNVGANGTMTATIANTGTAAANVTSLALTGSLDFSLVGAPATPFAVAAGGSATISVRYTPSGIGADSGSLAIGTSDAAHPSLSVALSGTGAANAVAVSPSSLSFGAVIIGQSSTLTLTISNSGNTAGTVSSIAKSGSANFALGAGAPATPFTVAAGASVTVPVVYTPTAAGAASGTLTITSNSPTTPVATVALSGTGNAPAAPNLGATPASLAFGTVNVGANGTMTAMISNTGSLAANVTSLTLTGSLNFSLVGAPATPFAVAPGGSSTITVRYTPSAAGAASGSLAIATTDPAHPSLSVALSGTGAANAVAVSPSSLSFGAVLIGNNSTLMLTISNSGNAAGTVSSIAKSGSANFALGAGAPATPFTVAAGASINIPVVYTPTAAGAASGMLTITSNNPTTPVATVALSGTGNAPAVSSLSATPTSLAFGSLSVGTPASQSVTLRNSGTASATVSSLALGGSADFKMATGTPATPLTVAAGGTVTLSVVYTPSVASAASGTLTIASNDPANPQIAIALSGTGTASHMTVSPVALDFGSSTVGTTVTRTTTVSNSGNAAGSVTALSLTGSTDFSLASTNPALPITVQPNASVTITAVYRPTAAGAASGALQVVTDDPSAALTSVALTGSGTAVVTTPSINVNPTSLALGNVNVGSTKTATATIQNTGTASLTVSALTVSGDTAFSASPAAPLTVAVGASATVTVTYAPTSAGASAGAALQIASNDPAKPTVSVTLSGAGVQSRIGVSPASLAFGSVNVGASKSLTVRITNSGSAAGSVSSITLNGSGAFALNSANPAMPLNLAAGAFADVTVNYTPTAATSDSSTLLATTSDAGAPVLSVALTGSGVAQPPPPPPSTGTVTLKANRLAVTSEITRPGRSVAITLSVLNTGRVNQSRPATIVGMQNNVEIYRQSKPVFAQPGGRAVNFQFPAYTPKKSGTINWTATIQNSATSSSSTTAKTSVRLPAWDDDDDDDDDDERD
ncbi:MAG: choice-of-anchor D domain-containing protein [Verrucomicrobia bacterium]|nr:choice-of-anchor D domain-containing protein [Verrucomicrobiota bacterium]